MSADPIVTPMVEAMTEMGFTGEIALEAATAAKVNNQTGMYLYIIQYLSSTGTSMYSLLSSSE